MNKFPSIISNTCWGGMMTNYYGSPYMSPFTGAFIVGKDYLQLLKKWKGLNFYDIGIIRRIDSQYEGLPIGNESSGNYPIVLLDGIEIHFPHYTDKANSEMKDIWIRRVARLIGNQDNLIFKFSKSRLATDDQLKEFIKMKLPGRKVLITDNVMPFLKYQVMSPEEVRVIQSNRLPNIPEVFDEPIESLHNLGWKLFDYEYDKVGILKGMNWIK